MTARSTRNKMRHQVEKVMNDLERAQGHFKMLSDLSAGESIYVDSHLPLLVALFDDLTGMMKKFREGL